MNMDQFILGASCFILIVSTLFLVPPEKKREACLIFLFKLALTWCLGLWVVQHRWIEYPVRLFFTSASKTSFEFEFIAYPILCVYFNLNYPQKQSFSLKHYFIFCSGITAYEFVLEQYTSLINYNGWEWYWTWTSLFITFFVSRMFYLWFFRIKVS